MRDSFQYRSALITEELLHALIFMHTDTEWNSICRQMEMTSGPVLPEKSNKTLTHNIIWMAYDILVAKKPAEWFAILAREDAVHVLKTERQRQHDVSDHEIQEAYYNFTKKMEEVFSAISPRASGLVWVKDNALTANTRIRESSWLSDKLGKTTKSEVEISIIDWERYGMVDLEMSDRVKVGESLFRPKETETVRVFMGKQITSVSGVDEREDFTLLAQTGGQVESFRRTSHSASFSPNVANRFATTSLEVPGSTLRAMSYAFQIVDKPYLTYGEFKALHPIAATTDSRTASSLEEFESMWSSGSSLTIDDVIIERYNHGRSHIMRKVLYAIFIQTTFTDLNLDPIVWRQIQIACVMERVDRESEINYRRAPMCNAIFNKNSAESFATFITKYESTLLHDEFTPLKTYISTFEKTHIAAEILELCHNIDLVRCWERPKFKRVIEDLRNRWGSENISALLNYAEMLVFESGMCNVGGALPHGMDAYRILQYNQKGVYDVDLCRDNMNSLHMNCRTRMCCMFVLNLEGVPFIDVVRSLPRHLQMYEEHEIILPRGCHFLVKGGDGPIRSGGWLIPVELTVRWDGSSGKDAHSVTKKVLKILKPDKSTAVPD